MDLGKLERKHLSYISKPNNIMDTTIDSYYQLDVGNNNMKLQLSHSTSGRLSSKTVKDFDRDSRMILHQSVPIDNTDSIIETFWRQIKILNIIKETIVSYKDTDDHSYLVFTIGTQWVIALLYIGSASDAWLHLIRRDLASVKKDIFTSFTEVASIYVQIEEDDKDSIVEIENAVNKAKLRDNVELTDQLWSNLKGTRWVQFNQCSRKKERTLKTIYHFRLLVVQWSEIRDRVRSHMCCQIQRCCTCIYHFGHHPRCIIKWMLKFYSIFSQNMPTNNNRLATWVRDLAEKRMAIPQLNGSEPLELLLEIGIEKLAKDYDFIFSESKICSADSLKFKEEYVIAQSLARIPFQF